MLIRAIDLVARFIDSRALGFLALVGVAGGLLAAALTRDGWFLALAGVSLLIAMWDAGA